MIRRVPVLILLGLLAACTSTTAEPAARPTTSSTPAVTPSPTPSATRAPVSLDWQKCDKRRGVDKQAQCSTLVVPLDRTGMVPGTITLQLVRRKATGDGKPIGSLLLNPGGPGASTVEEFDSLYAELDANLRSRFDVVGWDPRGTGNSSPVRCVSAKSLDRLLAASSDESTPVGLAQIKADAREYVDGCEKNSAPILPYVGTLNTVRDMDDIRAALGDDKVTYLGYSYGTELGYVYASLFPDHVRALALDGAIDPRLSPIDHSKSQVIGFQKALDAFLADCQKKPSACDWHFPGDVHAAYHALLAKVRATPVRTQDDARPLTEALFVSGVAAALYSRDSWQYLQAGLDGVRTGDGSVMLALADSLNGRNDNGTYDSIVDAFTAITCVDQPVPDGTEPWLAAARDVRAQAPDFADEGSVAPVGPGYVCSLFKQRPAVSALPSSVTGAPGALIVGTTGDPATPFAEAQGMTAAYAGSVLVTRKGEGHTGYSGSKCVRTAVDAYLLTGQLPAPGLVCES